MEFDVKLVLSWEFVWLVLLCLIFYSNLFLIREIFEILFSLSASVKFSRVVFFCSAFCNGLNSGREYLLLLPPPQPDLDDQHGYMTDQLLNIMTATTTTATPTITTTGAHTTVTTSTTTATQSAPTTTAADTSESAENEGQWWRPLSSVTLHIVWSERKATWHRS